MEKWHKNTIGAKWKKFTHKSVPEEDPFGGANASHISCFCCLRDMWKRARALQAPNCGSFELAHSGSAGERKGVGEMPTESSATRTSRRKTRSIKILKYWRAMRISSWNDTTKGLINVANSLCALCSSTEWWWCECFRPPNVYALLKDVLRN